MKAIPLPELNVVLIDKVMEVIETDPDHWKQRSWRHDGDFSPERVKDQESGENVLVTSCNTSFCFAGWACQLEGAKWVTVAHVLLEPGENDGTSDYPGAISASQRATRLLGLTRYEAEDLFAPGNSLGQVRDIVAGIKMAHDV
jgi:hypothetical protein